MWGYFSWKFSRPKLALPLSWRENIPCLARGTAWEHLPVPARRGLRGSRAGSVPALGLPTCDLTHVCLMLVCSFIHSFVHSFIHLFSSRLLSPRRTGTKQHRVRGKERTLPVSCPWPSRLGVFRCPWASSVVPAGGAHLILPTVSQSGYGCHPHFTNGETETQRWIRTQAPVPGLCCEPWCPLLPGLSSFLPVRHCGCASGSPKSPRSLVPPHLPPPAPPVIRLLLPLSLCTCRRDPLPGCSHPRAAPGYTQLSPPQGGPPPPLTVTLSCPLP